MSELILVGVYGIGIAAMYFAINDLVINNELVLTRRDKIKVAVGSLAWPYAFLYLAFYMMTDYVRGR